MRGIPNNPLTDCHSFHVCCDSRVMQAGPGQVKRENCLVNIKFWNPKEFKMCIPFSQTTVVGAAFSKLLSNNIENYVRVLHCNFINFQNSHDVCSFHENCLLDLLVC